jgi:transcription antitermination factor NusG
LERYPFYIESEEDSILVARYLIEENNEDHVEFDLDRTNKLHIVKSIFKNLVGNYKILDVEEEATLRKATVEVLII